MSKFTSIAIYSIIMGLSSFIAGLLPLSINFSENSLHLLSVFSVGLLISTGLVIIIPEGLERYTVEAPIGLWLLFGFITLFSIDRLTTILCPNQHNHSHQAIHGDGNSSMKLNDLSGGNSSIPTPVATAGDSFSIDDEDYSQDFTNASNSAKYQRSSISFVIPENASRTTMVKSIFQNTTTLGLVIHSLTDGLAMAASILATDSEDSVTFSSTVIVMAIFIHKLPASFALTSTLLNSREMSTREILYHLFGFSVSAPVGAFVTYFVITYLLQISFIALSGELLIFSGGSFLYVGFHSLHEMFNKETGQSGSYRLKDYLICVLGMLIPTFITFLKADVDV